MNPCEVRKEILSQHHCKRTVCSECGRLGIIPDWASPGLHHEDSLRSLTLLNTNDPEHIAKSVFLLFRC